MPTAEDVKLLFAEFPHEALSWRAQSVTKDGTKAMALAYIDARDVMDRLDSVCGADGWQCDYPHAAGKTVCRIGIKIGDEWIWKANGAGDTDIESEKGALSDAFKRAAVLWGIGRYLYDLEAPWVPCEAYEAEYQGRKKWVWKRWTVDPWSCIRGAARSSASMRKEVDARGDDLSKQWRHEISECATTLALDTLYKVWVANAKKDNWNGAWIDTMQGDFSAAKRKLIAEMEAGTPPKRNAYMDAMGGM